jgi:hypothetical protein
MIRRHWLRRGALPDDPSVAVGIAEEHERVPISARPVDPVTIVEVLDVTHIYAVVDRLGLDAVDAPPGPGTPL